MEKTDVITEPIIDLWTSVVSVLPEIIGALLVFILGLIIAPILGSLARRLVRLIKIDELAEKAGVTDMFESVDLKFTFSGLIGTLVRWFFVITFLIAAVDILGWERINQFLFEIVLYIPNVIVAVVILAIGMIAGKFVKDMVVKGMQASKMPINNPEILGAVAKYAIIVFAVLAALLQLGIAESLVQILFGGLVLAMALAFGLGGRDKAAKVLDKLDASK